MLYPLAIIKQNDKYHGQLPDFPNVSIKADTMIDTISSARQEVIRHLHHIAENDLPIPEGSDISSYLDHSDYAGWTWAIVSIDAGRIVGEAVEITVNIPERLLHKIQAHTAANHMDIETFFLQAAKTYLG